MHFVIVIVDGMADLPVSRLGGRTPLEVADIKNMNYLVSQGSSGLMYMRSQVTPSSDTAHLSILGYDPENYYTGRGIFEAAGAGLDVDGFDLFYRCNICEIGDDKIIINEKANLSKEEISSLEYKINDSCLREFKDVSIFFKNTLGFRGVLLLKGSGLNPQVLTPPPKRFSPLPSFVPLKKNKMAKKTAKILSRILHLSKYEDRSYKSYIIIPWGSSTKTSLPKFSDKYGIKGTVIAGVPLIKGIGRLCGMSVVEVPGATGDFNTDLNGKAKSTLEELNRDDNNLVLLHIEATDELSHDGNLEGKIKMIERVDEMLGKILDKVDLERTRIALLSDHVTSVELRSHTADPVPVVIAGGGFPRDGVEVYSERTTKKGGLGFFKAENFMTNFISRTHFH